MRLSFKCLPVGMLPYTDISIATKMIIKLFESNPYLPFFPNVNKNDNLIYRSLDKMPCVVLQNKKIILKDDTDKFIDVAEKIDKIYTSSDKSGIEKFGIDEEVFFVKQYYEILKRVKPKEAVISLLGPFSMIRKMQTVSGNNILSEKLYRRYIVQIVTLKALWFIKKIKTISPETIPLILFEEPNLNELGIAIKSNDDISRDNIVTIYSKIFQNIHAVHAGVGVHCLNKCDWQIPIEAGADLISFDGYNNPNNLVIIADKINSFLIGGGSINWAFVPAVSESIIKSLSIDWLYDRFIKTTDLLIEAGVSPDMLYHNSKISIIGDICNMPLIFAEKALMLSSQLSKKIPRKY